MRQGSNPGRTLELVSRRYGRRSPYVWEAVTLVGLCFPYKMLELARPALSAMARYFTGDDLTRLLSGKKVIYREGLQIYHVEIADLSINDDGVRSREGDSDLMMIATAQALPTHGLLYRTTPWTMAGRLSVLHVNANSIAASYAGWQVFTSPAVIADVLNAVAGLPERKTYLDDYTLHDAPNGTARMGVPGPYAKALLNVLRNVPYEDFTSSDGQ